MEGNKGIRGVLLTLLIFAVGCSPHETGSDVRILFSSGSLNCRSSDPAEDRISDVSLMIFDENGAAEECLYLNGAVHDCSTRLITGKKYIFCACVNFGYQVYADDITELEDVKYHLAYPDEYSSGIPMYGYQEVTIQEGGTEVCLNLERLMAKISIRMDRRKLSEGIEMNVRSVSIGNCPRVVSVFRSNSVRNEDDCFPAGFSRSGSDSDNLNRISEGGLSEAVSLYMLENLQGELDGPITEDNDKVFGADNYRSRVCSYIEMELEYMSDTYYSTGKGLIYRFYLGEDRNSLNIERNSHYQITVTPEDTGLSHDGWRVDKTDLLYSGPTSLRGYPSDYIVGDIGDKVHIWCEFTPEETPFDIGISYLEEDRIRGIYDYVVDNDGRGAVLTLRKPGRGMVYMEAGPPINDAALFIVEVNLPQTGQATAAL